MAPDRLAVWGDPISHSRSPALHAAAYDLLDLPWSYSRARVSAAEFGERLSALDGSWRGLSLTMPLKEEAYRAAEQRDRYAELTGAVNTLVLGERIRGFNTDVGGIVDALIEGEATEIHRVRILGAGATAASALVAASELGAGRAEVRARRPEKAQSLCLLGDRLGVDVAVHPFDAPVATVDLTVATLPSGTALDEEVAGPLRESGGSLFEAAYAPWPSSLAEGWSEGAVISGLSMLLHQAVRQVRIFLNESPDAALPKEEQVIAVMRAALMGD